MSNPPERSRVFFVGLDAADKDLILDGARSGRLPRLRSLLEGSAWGETDNPAGLFVGAIWPSFATGASPARHRRYCYRQWVPGSYRDAPFAAERIAAEPFWKAIGEADRRVAVVDVPKTALTTGLNGIQIADWGTHDPEHRRPVSWPAPLAAEMAGRFGGDPVGPCDTIGREPRGILAFRDALRERIRRRVEMLEHLARSEPWDLFAAVFSESHCAGHQLWHIHDTAHPRHDPALARRVGDPLLEVYGELDAAVGRLLDGLGSDWTVFVLASHGMGPHYDANFLLDEILRRIESPGSEGQARRGAVARLSGAWRRLPRPVRGLFSPWDKRLRQAIDSALLAPRRAARKCFAVPNNDVCGAVRINLAGREPDGRVAPGELASFRAMLEAELMALENPATGEPLVRRVVATREIYEGPFLDELPDLLVEWNREAPVTGARSPRIGLLRGEYTGHRTGDHKPHGLLMAAGRGVAARPIGRRVSVLDLAPTFARILGVPLPGCDGTPIRELCEPAPAAGPAAR